jgi:hypothetical protein
MNNLGDKLGPTVFQFPFFSRAVFKTQADFLGRLTPFLKKLPHDNKFAVEIRNKEWLDARLADLLREHRVALVLQDRSRMPGPTELADKFDPITTDWTYIRWLGDRKGIEEITKCGTRLWLIALTSLALGWISATKRRNVASRFTRTRLITTQVGPATVELFRNLWSAKGLPEIAKPPRKPQESLLFDL